MAMRTNDNNILDAVTVISEQGFDGMAEALRILLLYPFMG